MWASKENLQRKNSKAVLSSGSWAEQGIALALVFMEPLTQVPMLGASLTEAPGLDTQMPFLSVPHRFCNPSLAYGQGCQLTDT